MDKTKRNQAQYKYNQAHLKRIALDMQKEYYSNVFLPYISNHNYTASGFIKSCVDYVISNNIKL